MKHPQLVASLVLILAVACSPDPSGVNAAEPQNGSQKEPAEALDDFGSAAKDKALEFADLLRDQLAGVDDHLAKLAKRLEGTDGAAREKFDRALDELEEKRQAVGAKLAELGEKGGLKFEAAKREIERATAELAQDLARALEQFE